MRFYSDLIYIRMMAEPSIVRSRVIFQLVKIYFRDNCNKYCQAQVQVPFQVPFQVPGQVQVQSRSGPSQVLTWTWTWTKVLDLG